MDNRTLMGTKKQTLLHLKTGEQKEIIFSTMWVDGEAVSCTSVLVSPVKHWQVFISSQICVWRCVTSCPKSTYFLTPKQKSYADNTSNMIIC